MGIYDTNSGKYSTSGPELAFHGPTPIEDEASIIQIFFLLLSNGVSEEVIRAALRKFIGKEPLQRWFTEAKKKLQLEKLPEPSEIEDPFQRDEPIPPEEPSSDSYQP